MGAPPSKPFFFWAPISEATAFRREHILALLGLDTSISAIPYCPSARVGRNLLGTGGAAEAYCRWEVGRRGEVLVDAVSRSS
jgi:hypothetical protein